MDDGKTTVQSLKSMLKEFNQKRGWGKHHTSRNLAISIAIEAGELLEHFQWGDYAVKDQKELEGELADILIYCLHLANAEGMDVSTIVREKLEKVEKKYPVELFNETRDCAEDYWNIKKKHRKP